MAKEKYTYKVRDEVSNPYSGLGGVGDAGTRSRPTLEGRLSDIEIEELYTQNQLTKKIINTLPEEALAAGIMVNGQQLSEFLIEHKVEVDARTILNLVLDVAINARLKGVGALFLVRKGASIESYARPLPENPKPIKAVQALGKDHLDIMDIDEDIFSQGFETPLTYNVGSMYGGTYLLVHRDHLLVLDGAKLIGGVRELNEGFHDSMLQAVWGAIRRFLDTENAMASILQKFETMELSIAGLSNTLLDDRESNLLVARMSIFAQTLSALNIALTDADAGESFKRTFATVSGMEMIWDRLAHSVAMASDIPMTKLMGMSPSGQSTDDAAGRANWRVKVSTYQDNILTPILLPLLEYWSNTEKLEIAYNQLREQTAAERSASEESFARMALSLKTTGSSSAEEIRKEQYNRGIFAEKDKDPNWEPPTDSEEPGPDDAIKASRAEPNPEGGIDADKYKDKSTGPDGSTINPPTT